MMRNMRRRRALGALLAVSAGMALTGCAPAAGGDAGGEVEIRFVWWGGDERTATTRAVIEQFEEANPGITVVAEPTSFESYWDKLATDAAAGNLPDVITLASPFTLEYAHRGTLLPLDDVAGSLDRSAFAESVLQGAMVDGVAYGLPTGGNAIGVVANTRLFEEAGVPLPEDETWTWEDFVEIAARITEASPEGVYGMEDRINDTLGVYVTQRGTYLYDEDGSLGVGADVLEDYWEMVIEMRDSGAMPPADLTQEIYTLGAEETLMGQGKAGMSFAFSNLVETYAAASGDELVLLRPPGESEHARAGATIQASQYYGIASTSAHPDASARLIDHLVNSTDAGKLILADRGLPFNEEVLDAVTPMLDPAAQLAAEYVQVTLSNGTDPAPASPPGASVQKEVSERLDGEVLFGRLTPADAARQFVEEMEAALG